MKKIILLLSLFVGCVAKAQINIADKVNGNSYTAAEFNAIKNSIGITKPTVAAMLAAPVPLDSTIVTCGNYYNDYDNIITMWIYFASSTTTTNGMTVLGTTGRYKLIIAKNYVTFKQLGVFDIGTDQSTGLQAAINLMVNVATVAFDKNSRFKANGLQLPTGTKITSEDYTGIISPTAYTSLNGGNYIMGWNGNSGNISKDVQIKGVHFEGATAYGSDTITSTTVNDTISTAITILYTNNWLIEDCTFKSGFNRGAVYPINSPYLYVHRNRFDTTGGVPYITFYATTNDWNRFNDNIVSNYAMRWVYDAQKGRKRNGDVAFQPGSANFEADNNIIYNNGDGWAVSEGRFNGGINKITRNKYYSRGRLSGGYSYVGNTNNSIVIIDGNWDMDINNFAYTRHDSFPATGTPIGLWPDFGKVDEITDFGGLTYTNNHFNGVKLRIGGKAKNITVMNNVIDNSRAVASLNPAAGTSDYMVFGNGAGFATDTTVKPFVANNTVTMGAGGKYVTFIGGSYVTGASFYDNVTGVDYVDINASILKSDPYLHDKIIIGGVWKGYYGVRAMSTAAGQVVDVSSSHFEGTNILSDSAATGNLIYASGAKALINRDGATFIDAQPFREDKKQPKQQMLAVVLGNSIPGYNSNPGSADGGDILIANQLTDALYFKPTTSSSVLNTFGIYSYGGQKLSTILADLPTNFYPAIKTAGIIPDIVLLHALAENSIIQGDSLDVIQSQINGLITDVRNRWPGVIIHLVCPRLAVNYDTPAKVSIWRRLTTWYFTLDNNNDIFVTKANLYEDPSNPGWPSSGYTDGIHPHLNAAILLGREEAKTFQRISKVWKTSYATASNNMSLTGSTSVNSTTNVTGTRPSTVTFSGISGDTVAAVAENPGLLVNYKVASSPTDNHTSSSFDFGSITTSLNKASAFVKVQIVSGAENIKCFSALNIYSDGTGTNFVNLYGVNDNISQTHGLWQNGDVLIFRDIPGTAARTGTITASQLYFYVKPKLPASHFSFRIIAQGVGELQ